MSQSELSPSEVLPAALEWGRGLVALLGIDAAVSVAEVVGAVEVKLSVVEGAEFLQGAGAFQARLREVLAAAGWHGPSSLVVVRVAPAKSNQPEPTTEKASPAAPPASRVAASAFVVAAVPMVVWLAALAGCWLVPAGDGGYPTNTWWYVCVLSAALLPVPVSTIGLGLCGWQFRRAKSPWLGLLAALYLALGVAGGVALMSAT